MAPEFDPDWLLAEYPQPSGFKKLRRQALDWFASHQRDLPWRRDHSLYRVWVSEIMLQQTQVQTVIDYFHRFLKQFPTIQALADAPENQVLSAWEGLGYYRRARSLHAAAKTIRDQYQGRFPDNFDQVLRLPGIGRYTAGAILSIALDQKWPILEGNTYRLYSRLLGLTQDPRERGPEKLLWQFATDLLPGPRSTQSSGQLNQALMEIGSEVCKVKNPLCDACPLRSGCNAHRLGFEKVIPQSRSKIQYENRQQALLILEDSARNLLVRQRQPGEWWSGLWDFVRLDVPDDPTDSNHDGGPKRDSLAKRLSRDHGLQVNIPAQPDFRLKHAVTRYRIQLDCYHIRDFERTATSDYQPQSLAAISSLPLNITARRALKRLLHRS